MNFGICGFGRVVENYAHAGIVGAGGRVVALSARNAERAAALAQRYGVPGAYTSPEELVADPKVEAVLVASPNPFHRAHVALAARAGKHVLCEKPLALSSGDARAMADLCRTRGVHLHVVRPWVFTPLAGAFRDALTGLGALGRVEVVLEKRGSVAAEQWRRQPGYGGDVLFELAPHCLDMIRFYIGEVQQVCGASALQLRDWGILDTVTALVTAGAGVPCVVHVSYAMTSWRGIRAWGENGTAALRQEGEDWVVEANGREVRATMNRYLPQVRHFISCIRGGETPLADAAEGIRALEIAEEIRALCGK